ncbi:MAG: hypothetical protein ACXAD7_12530 [Candidatus Kariarchaeaceae archaeon]|jgi:hypothetical protein
MNTNNKELQMMEQISADDIKEINLLIEEISRTYRDSVKIDQLEEIRRITREKIFHDIELSMTLHGEVKIHNILNNIRKDTAFKLQTENKEEVLYSLHIPNLRNIYNKFRMPSNLPETSDLEYNNYKSRDQTIKYLLPLTILSVILSFFTFHAVFIFILVGIYVIFSVYSLFILDRVNSLWVKLNLIMILNTFIAVTGIILYGMNGRSHENWEYKLDNLRSSYDLSILVMISALLLSFIIRVIDFRDTLLSRKLGIKMNNYFNLVARALVISSILSISLIFIMYLHTETIVTFDRDNDTGYLDTALLVVEIVLAIIVFLIIISIPLQYFDQITSKSDLISEEKRSKKTFDRYGNGSSQANREEDASLINMSNEAHHRTKENVVSQKEIPFHKASVNIDLNKSRKYFQFSSGIIRWFSYILLIIIMYSSIRLFYLEKLDYETYIIPLLNYKLSTSDMIDLHFMIAIGTGAIWLIIRIFQLISWFSKKEKKMVLSHLMLREGIIPYDYLIESPKNMDLTIYNHNLGELIIEGLVSIKNIDHKSEETV